MMLAHANAGKGQKATIMRLLDRDHDQSFNNLGLYLTPSEALQKIGYLKGLLDDPDANHSYLNDSEYKHEVTLTIYTDSNIQHYDERSKRLLLENKMILSARNSPEWSMMNWTRLGPLEQTCHYQPSISEEVRYS